MRISLLTIALTFVLYSFSCHSSTKQTSNLQPEVIPHVILKPINAGLDESRKISIDINKSRLPDETRFLGAQFVNARTGWAFNARSLFRTSDEAKSWMRLPLSLSENSNLSSVFFIDQEHGWLASHVRLILKPDDPANASIVLVTSDGGMSWSEQVTFRNGIEIEQLKFVDANQGLAIGSHRKPPHVELFVAKTTDGGKNWIDISENVKRATSDGTRSSGGLTSDVYWMSSDEILLLLSGPGKIIRTSDAGQTWKTILRFEDERPGGWASSTGYYRLVMNGEQRFSVIAGAMGDEGYYGDFVVQDDQNTWLSYELQGVPIFDAVFLSDNEVLACGYALYRTNDKSTVRDVGILLHSSDSGRNWTPIYRSTVEESFIHLSKIGGREFYAVSDAGTVLRFTLDKK